MPVRRRVRRWRVGPCRLRICRSTAGTRPPLVGPWPVPGWLWGAQWGTGGPGSRRRGGVDGGGIAGAHREIEDEREGERRSRVRDGEGFRKAVVGDGEAKEFGSDGMGFGVVKGRETRDKKVEVRAVRILYAKVVND